MIDVIVGLLPILFLLLTIHYFWMRKQYHPTVNNYFIEYIEEKDYQFWNEKKSYFYILLIIDVITFIIILLYFISVRYTDPIPLIIWVYASVLFLYIGGFMPWKAYKNVQMKVSTLNGEGPDDEEEIS